jgi:transcriptional regulator with XRE-family HTH domain
LAYISGIERGKRNVALRNIENIAKALKTDWRFASVPCRSVPSATASDPPETEFPYSGQKRSVPAAG